MWSQNIMFQTIFFRVIQLLLAEKLHKFSSIDMVIIVIGTHKILLKIYAHLCIITA